MRLTADSWDAYPARYEAKRRQAENRRQRRRDARKRKAAGRRPAAACDEAGQKHALLGELARERVASRGAAVAARLREGFQWPGGAVAGNPRYFLRAFVTPGLPSEAHPLLRLFVAQLPRACRLLTGDDKARVSGTDSKLLALDCPYVVTNGEMRGVLRVELDRDLTDAELRAGLAACAVPMPTLVVGYRDAAGRWLHPHLLWQLGNAVPFKGKGRRGPQGLWKATLAALTAALLPLGADPGGLSNALRVKNPLSPLWDCAVMAPQPYALNPDAGGLPALVPRLDLEGASTRLRAAAVAGADRPFSADHPDPEVIGQSNAAFRHLAGYARRRVALHRDHGAGSEAEFLAELAAEACRILPRGQRGERAARYLAATVSAWTWAHHRMMPPTPSRLTPAEVRGRQVAGQAKGAATRRAETLDAIVAAVRRLASAGQQPTQAAVAVAAGRSVRTVRERWAEVQARLAEPAVQFPPIDKKGFASRARVRAIPEVHGAPEPAGPPLGPAPAQTPCGPSGMAGSAVAIVRLEPPGRRRVPENRSPASGDAQRRPGDRGQAAPGGSARDLLGQLPAFPPAPDAHRGAVTCNGRCHV